MPPEYAIVSEREVDGRKVVEVDTDKATFQGTPWKDLGDFGKAKLENLLVLEKLKDGLKVKVIYS